MLMQVKEVTYRVWLVPSETQEGVEYTVVYDPVRGRFLCDCPGYTAHKTRCKHIDRVVEMLRREAGL
jgi:hypothetical protein